MSKATFSEEARSSGDGMQTRIWGPSLWFFLHTMSANYPVKPTPEKRKQHVQFMLSLGTVLPCVYCRNNFRSNLRAALWEMRPAHISKATYSTTPLAMLPAFDTRESFFELVWCLHKNVSIMLRGAEYKAPSLEKTRDMYEGFRARCLTQDEQVQASGELGCTEPMYHGTKGQCRVEVVPKGSAGDHHIRVTKACKVRKVKSKH